VQVILTEIALVVAASIVVAFVLRRLQVPTAVGFVVAGVLLGPGGLGLVRDRHQIEVLAEIGVVLLLFAVGLKLSIRDMWRLRGITFIGGGLQVLATGVLAGGAAVLAGRPPAEAVVWGAVVALSSTALVMTLLETGGDTGSVLLFQDLAVVPMILALPLLAGSGGSPGRLAGIAAQSLAIVVITVVGARVLFPRLTALVVATGSRELFTLTTVLAAIGTALLFGHFGLSMALGAFLAGVVISESAYVGQMIADITPLRDVFNSLFFVSMGMLVDPADWLQQPLLLALLVAAVIVGKAVVAGGAAYAVLRNPAVAVAVGLGLAQIGEFSVIVAYEAGRIGLMDDSARELFLSVAVPTMLLTPVCVALGRRLAKVLAPGRARGAAVETLAGPRLADHVVIVGYGVNGRNVARALTLLEVPYLVIDLNPHAVEEVIAAGGRALYGDASRDAVQRAAGVQAARGLVAAIADAACTREVVATARRLNPRVTIVARTRFLREVEPLTELGADQVIPEEFETSIELTGRVLAMYGASPRVIVREKEALRAGHYGPLRAPRREAGGHLTLEEMRGRLEFDNVEVEAGSAAVGATLRGLALRERTGVTVLAVERAGELAVNPDPDRPLEAGDRLLVAAAGEAIVMLRAEVTAQPTDALAAGSSAPQARVNDEAAPPRR
jgi:CPA2 family monovalent cation:H+ antiporter-2